MTKTATILPLFLLFNLLIISSQSNLGTWLKKGAYVEYTSTRPPAGSIVFSNGTRIKYEGLDFPATLRWEVIEIKDNIANLNLSFSLKGNATIIKLDNTLSYAQVDYRRTVLIDVNTQTGDASVDGEAIGKISLWTETNVIEGQRIEIFSPPSDRVEGTVTRLSCLSLMGRRISAYEVEVFQINPFAVANFVFDQQIGLALVYTLLGPVEILPNSTHTYMFSNGTIHNITSYAKTKLTEKLGLRYTYVLTADKTNITLGDPQPVNAQAYIAVFAALFIALMAIFIFVDKKRHKHRQTSLKLVAKGVRSLFRLA